MDPNKDYTVTYAMFQNSCWWCLNVLSPTTSNRVFLKPTFEGVNGHLQNTFTCDSESIKGVLRKYIHISFSTPTLLKTGVFKNSSLEG